MTSIFFKQGIQSIKDTKKYAREKNVPNWSYQVILSSIFTLYLFTSLYGSSIMYLAPILPAIPDIMINIIHLSPIFMSFLFMMKYGQYPIKLTILLNSYLQKGIMKLINRLDMYYWRKYDKDSVASNFILKHRKLVLLVSFIPLIIYIIFS